jgi:hypothetical protein
MASKPAHTPMNVTNHFSSRQKIKRPCPGSFEAIAFISLLNNQMLSAMAIE